MKVILQGKPVDGKLPVIYQNKRVRLGVTPSLLFQIHTLCPDYLGEVIIYSEDGKTKAVKPMTPKVKVVKPNENTMEIYIERTPELSERCLVVRKAERIQYAWDRNWIAVSRMPHVEVVEIVSSNSLNVFVSSTFEGRFINVSHLRLRVFPDLSFEAIDI